MKTAFSFIGVFLSLLLLTSLLTVFLRELAVPEYLNGYIGGVFFVAMWTATQYLLTKDK